MELTIGQTLVAFGWCGIIVGIVMGGILSTYAFSGPFRPPKGHEDYTSINRRMMRLAHIAAVMLPLISIVYGEHLDTVDLSDGFKYWGAVLMMVFTVGIPSLLVLSCFHLSFKYLQIIPINSGLASLIIMAGGQVNLL